MTKDNLESKNYSVVIVGGGPAGIATAITLNALGISHCVIEASTMPKQKIGEALPPNSKPILKQLGIHSLVAMPPHQNYYGNQSCWGNNHIEQKDFISDIHGHGYLLDRLFFENQLWEYYCKSKGELFTGCKLKKLNRNTEGVNLTIDNKDQLININCKYVADATGRKATVCRHLGVQKINLDEQFALSFTLKLAQPLGRQILVEATPQGWWYAAPFRASSLTVMFFTLKQLLPQKEEINSFLTEELNSSLHLSQIISTRDIIDAKVKIIPAGTSRLPIPYGDNWVAVGDAAAAFDPISSYGITSALATGYYAGQALASKLSGKEEAMDAYRYIVENAFQAYIKKLNHHYSQERRWPASIYWKKRF